MINTASFDAVDSAVFGPKFRRPLPDSYSFAGLPAFVRHALTGTGPAGLPDDVLGALPRQYDRVALILLDAFGWSLAERYLARSPLLRLAAEEGVVSKLSSQFPSTTTAHVTTLTFAQPVGQHGLYEWFLYEPALDSMVIPLWFCYADDQQPNNLPLDPRQMAPGPTFFQQLAAEGIRSAAAQRRDIFTSGAAQYTLANIAYPLPFDTLAGGLDSLAGVLETDAGPLFAYLYHTEIDKLSHDLGPDSPEVAAEVESALHMIERRLVRRLSRKGTGRTLLLITADHGQMTVRPEDTIYVNEIIPALEGMVRRSANGQALAPAGSSRDLFLHIQPGLVDEAAELLRSHPALAGRAEVWTTRQLSEAGLFGATSEAFWRRVGDIVVLPYDGQMVWWRDLTNPKHTQGFHGHHGGLSAQEMTIPLIALAL